MAAQILHTANTRLEREHRGVDERPASRWLTQFRHDTATPVHHQLVVSDVAVQERPPLADVRDVLATAPGVSTSTFVDQRP
jgi:glucosyl-3-phosphoglycerate synthase